MTPYSVLTTDQQAEMARAAMAQLEAQHFECTMNIDMFGEKVLINVEGQPRSARLQLEQLNKAITALKTKYERFLKDDLDEVENGSTRT